jgi:putative transcriptional regulator
MTNPFVGKSLVAMPRLDDPWFSRSVVCMAIHDAGGSFGLVVNNRVHGLSEADVLLSIGLPAQHKGAASPVFCGGPVREDGLFILHGPPFDWKSCLPITPYVGLSFSRDIVEAIAKDKGPQHYKMMLGCAGWSPGQLEDEICENIWLVHAVPADLLLSCPAERCWDEVLLKMGIRPEFLALDGGTA